MLPSLFPSHSSTTTLVSHHHTGPISRWLYPSATTSSPQPQATNYLSQHPQALYRCPTHRAKYYFFYFFFFQLTNCDRTAFCRHPVSHSHPHAFHHHHQPPTTFALPQALRRRLAYRSDTFFFSSFFLLTLNHQATARRRSQHRHFQLPCPCNPCCV